MSFSFRDKGRLSDRLRGKTCDEILKELRDHLHQDRSMSFESSPSWGGFTGPAFSRAGFPFMDQDMMSRPDMRARFEDLASRHPEFADHLRPTAWGTVPEGEPHFFQTAAAGPELYRQRHASGSSGSGSGVYSEDGSIPIPVIHEDSGGGEGGSSRSRTRKIPQYGLRNTVDLGESHKLNPSDTTEGEARSQRSWSAPPDNRGQGEAPQPKRFVTRIDINNSPANPSTCGTNDTATANTTSGVSSPGKPPPFPKSPIASSPQSQQSTSKQSNVRHIPIFVEGRDEPVLPKPREGHSFASSHSSGFGQPNFSYSYAQAAPGTHSTAFASSHASSPPGHSKSQPNPPQGHRVQPQANASQEQKQNIPPKQQPQPVKPVIPKDPIAKVQAIQEEVNELKNLVENFSGSKNDKEYVYLDEMLTRNLLKLDDIETDGKENIRLARKEAIRSIQKCISILESKAPLSQERLVEEPAEEDQQTDRCMDDGSQIEDCKEQILEPSVNLNENVKEDTVPSDSMEVYKTGSSELTNSSDAEKILVKNNNQSEMPMDVTPDVETDKKEESTIDSSNSGDKQENCTLLDQDSEKMEVISEPNLEKSQAEGNLDEKGTDDKRVEAADNTSIDAANTTSEHVDTKTEPDKDSSSELANIIEATSTATKDAAIVKETGNIVTEAAKPMSGVEDSSSEEATTMSEVEVTKSDATNPQNSVSPDGSGEALCEGNESTEAVSQQNLNATEINQSVVPPNVDSNKTVSS